MFTHFYATNKIGMGTARLPERRQQQGPPKQGAPEPKFAADHMEPVVEEVVEEVIEVGATKEVTEQPAAAPAAAQVEDAPK